MDNKTQRILGIHFLGDDASELIGEAAVIVAKELTLMDIARADLSTDRRFCDDLFAFFSEIGIIPEKSVWGYSYSNRSFDGSVFSHDVAGAL